MGNVSAWPQDEEVVSILKPGKQSSNFYIIGHREAVYYYFSCIFQDLGKTHENAGKGFPYMGVLATPHQKWRAPYNHSQCLSTVLLRQLSLTNLQKSGMPSRPHPTSVTCDGWLVLEFSIRWLPVQPKNYPSAILTLQCWYFRVFKFQVPMVLSHGRQLQNKQVELEISSWLFLTQREGLPQVTTNVWPRNESNQERNVSSTANEVQK